MAEWITFYVAVNIFTCIFGFVFLEKLCVHKYLPLIFLADKIKIKAKMSQNIYIQVPAYVVTHVFHKLIP